jgi:hypothetical protein
MEAWSVIIKAKILQLFLSVKLSAMKYFIFAGVIAFFTLVSCSECHVCTKDGNEERVCRKHFSKKKDYNSQLDSAKFYNWSCTLE